MDTSRIMESMAEWKPFEAQYTGPDSGGAAVGPSPSQLTARQTTLFSLLTSVATQFGKFGQDDGPDGAEYEKGSANDEKPGIECGNCAFYSGAGTCTIVDGLIDEEGVCKFALVPLLLVGKDPDDDDDNGGQQTDTDEEPEVTIGFGVQQP